MTQELKRTIAPVMGMARGIGQAIALWLVSKSAAALVAVVAFAAAALPVTANEPDATEGRKHDPDALRQAAMNNGGNAGRGKVIFKSNAAKCLTCHKVQGKGGDVGPELSQVGGKFDRTHLIESILDPSAQIPEGFYATMIATTAGRIFTGIVKTESAAEIVLVDVGGKRVGVPVSDIESRTLSNVSLMPTGMHYTMTPAEFTDLIAYLASLRTGRQPTPGEGSLGKFDLAPGFSVEEVASGLTGVTALESSP